MAAVKKAAVYTLSQPFIQLIKAKTTFPCQTVKYTFFFPLSDLSEENDQVLLGVCLCMSIVPGILGGDASGR